MTDADAIIRAGDTIAVYVCTHERNGPLTRLLRSIEHAASRVQPELTVAVVVIDDNPDGRAKAVVEELSHSFAGGLHYRFSGARNISMARNLGIEAGLELGEWVAMTDDDQVVSPGWLAALVETQRQTSADAVTGPVQLRYAQGAPSWLSEQPFGELLEAPIKADGAPVEECSTGNSMIRAAFLRANPDIRFRVDLGTLGGEDMVFYQAATAAGLRAHYSLDALCWAEQPLDRSTYRHTLRAAFWLGNSEFVTGYERGGTARPRFAVRGVVRFVRALRRPVQRLLHREDLQLRYSIAAAARALGLAAGSVGLKVQHR